MNVQPTASVPTKDLNSMSESEYYDAFDVEAKKLLEKEAKAAAWFASDDGVAKVQTACDVNAGRAGCYFFFC